ncbi:MAG TPA: response regulator [Gemmatimonadaceae bacterium]|jgi:DNA-binding response OmpR family regulator
MNARILVIDDDPVVRGMLVEMLQRAGYDVDSAEDGRAGMRRFHEQPSALVITDVVMPEQEGLETLMQLRHSGRPVKVMAISGGGRVGPDAYLNSARTLGADAILAKPFGREELLEKVSALLST